MLLLLGCPRGWRRNCVNWLRLGVNRGRLYAALVGSVFTSAWFPRRSQALRRIQKLLVGLLYFGTVHWVVRLILVVIIPSAVRVWTLTVTHTSSRRIQNQFLSIDASLSVGWRFKTVNSLVGLRWEFSPASVHHLVRGRLDLCCGLHWLLPLEVSAPLFETLRDVERWSSKAVPICSIGRRLFIHIICWRSYMGLCQRSTRNIQIVSFCQEMSNIFKHRQFVRNYKTLKTV